MIYIVSYIPFTKANYIKERMINPDYKYISFKKFLSRNLLISFIFVIIGFGFALGATYGQTNSPRAKLIEQLNNFEKTKIDIKGEDLSIEFNENDYAYIENIIKNELGENSIYKIVLVKDVTTDANGEKYIEVTYAGYNDKGSDIMVFQFRKYVTMSNYHKLGEIELYRKWVSFSITRDDIK